ncbi:hypothetical protein [Paenibacillus solanacearum]|uniref:hypothetical protein n=1 Tax=Paenibacillus solanacearum TaxID=2048548 RepID=UPI001C4014A4|nr:hypothetical protein [Paenibacillus solanacearum]
MDADIFEHRDIIAKNIIAFMRQRGYSRLSLSKLAGIPRAEIDKLLNPDYPNSRLGMFVKKIIDAFDLPSDYFQNANTNSISPTKRNRYNNRRNPKAIELFEGLENVLDIYSMYLK